MSLPRASIPDQHPDGTPLDLIAWENLDDHGTVTSKLITNIRLLLTFFHLNFIWRATWLESTVTKSEYVLTLSHAGITEDNLRSTTWSDALRVVFFSESILETDGTVEAHHLEQDSDKQSYISEQLTLPGRLFCSVLAFLQLRIANGCRTASLLDLAHTRSDQPAPDGHAVLITLNNHFAASPASLPYVVGHSSWNFLPIHQVIDLQQSTSLVLDKFSHKYVLTLIGVATVKNVFVQESNLFPSTAAAEHKPDVKAEPIVCWYKASTTSIPQGETPDSLYPDSAG